jgi:three-Cys-motif partner protein
MASHHGAEDDDFFEHRTASSAKKGAIVERFFKAWASIVGRHSPRLLYLDVFAGPGSYDRDENGAPATPEHPVYATAMRVLKAVCDNPSFTQAVISIFNDGNARYVEQLKANINALPGSELLRYKPQVFCGMVSEQITQAFMKAANAPACFFVDPFGYKGLTKKLIASVLTEWGSDCLLFFSYNRINRAIGHDAFDEHLNALFGDEELAQLRARLSSDMSPTAREDVIMSSLFAALGTIGGDYCIKYRFRAKDGKTRHFLVFTSKRIEGYDAMKKAMAQESDKTSDNVPTYEFAELGDQPTLFAVPTQPRAFPWTIAWLCRDLQTQYAQLERSFASIVKEHNVGLPYLEPHYRAAIKQLNTRGAVTLRKPDGSKVKANTCPPDTLVYFKVPPLTTPRG